MAWALAAAGRPGVATHRWRADGGPARAMGGDPGADAAVAAAVQPGVVGGAASQCGGDSLGHAGGHAAGDGRGVVCTIVGWCCLGGSGPDLAAAGIGPLAHGVAQCAVGPIVGGRGGCAGWFADSDAPAAGLASAGLAAVAPSAVVAASACACRAVRIVGC